MRDVAEYYDNIKKGRNEDYGLYLLIQNRGNVCCCVQY